MPIPATTSMAHLRENLDAQEIELSRADIQSIDSIPPAREDRRNRTGGVSTMPLTPEPSSL